MNVIAADITAKEHTNMKHFTIDTDNNITVHSSKKAAREAGAGGFSSEEQLAELIGPDNKRLVEIWNSLPGVTPVASFRTAKSPPSGFGKPFRPWEKRRLRRRR